MTSATSSLKHALIVYFLALLGGSVFAIFIEANLPGSASPLGAVIAFSAAAWAGQVFVEKNLRRSDHREKLRFGLITALAPILLGAALILGTLIYLRLILGLNEADLSQGLLARDKLGFLALVAAIALPLGFAVSWLGFTFGVRSGERQRMKKAAK